MTNIEPPITPKKLRELKIKDKLYKVTVYPGLHLRVHPNGSKYWQVRYRLNGKEKTASLGNFPEKSFAVARDECNEIKIMVKQGIDPVKKDKEKSETFGVLVELFLKNKAKEWANNTLQDAESRINNHVIPVIGSLPIKQIDKGHLSTIYERLQQRNLNGNTIRKVFHLINNVFIYSIRWHDTPDRNIVADILPTLPSGGNNANRDALTKHELGVFWNKLNSYGGRYETVCALRLLTWTASRPGEIQKAEWSEFDLDSALWTIPSVRMKKRIEHVSPLPGQAVQMLRDLHRLTGTNKFVFPNQSRGYPKKQDSPMSENTLNLAIKRMGFDASAHGMRSVFSTIANELGLNPDAVEKQLAHSLPGGEIRKIYNRSTYLDERRQIVQVWADYLEGLPG